MHLKELLDELDKTKQNIKKYRNSFETRYKSLYEENENQDETIKSIQLKSKEILNESFLLGNVGKPCPKCSGTGRV